MAPAPGENAYIWGPLVSVLVIAVANLIAYAANESSWIFRRLLAPCGVRPLLFISNRAEGVDRHARPVSYWAFDLLNPAHLVYSHCLNTPMLLVLHSCTFLYFVITVLVDVVIDFYRPWCDHPGCNRNYGAYPQWMSFLTNWSITLLGLAGLVALANTARYYHRQRQQSHNIKQLSEQRSSSWPGSNAGFEAQQASTGSSNSANGGSDAAVCVTCPPQSTAHINYSAGIPSAPQKGSIPTSGASIGYPAGNSTQPLHDQHYPRCSLPQQQQQKQHAGLNQPQLQALHLAHAYQHQPNNGVSTAPGSIGNLALAPNGSPYSTSSLPGAAPAAAAAPAHHAGASGCMPCTRRNAAAAGTAGAAVANAGPADTVVMVQDGSPTREVPVRQLVLKHQWDCLSCTHCILMEVATAAAFFVSFWYWVGIVGIAQSGFDVSAGTFLAHAGNVVVAFLQIVLTRLPMVSYHFQVLLWYATAYMIFLWVFGELSSIWRYSLNWQVSKAAIAFILIPILTFVMFMLWFLAAKVREGVLCTAKKHKQQTNGAHNAHNGTHHTQRAVQLADG